MLKSVWDFFSRAVRGALVGAFRAIVTTEMVIGRDATLCVLAVSRFDLVGAAFHFVAGVYHAAQQLPVVACGIVLCAVTAATGSREAGQFAGYLTVAAVTILAMVNTLNGAAAVLAVGVIGFGSVVSLGMAVLVLCANIAVLAKATAPFAAFVVAPLFA